MDTLITLIMIVDNTNNIQEVLKNIKSQSLKNWELFILLKSIDLNVMKLLNDDRITVIEITNNTTILKCFLSILPIFKGDLIVFLNSLDINHPKRLEIQSFFMEKNNSIPICSCLELPLNIDSTSFRDSNDSNKFITSSEIDFAVLGGYIPLDIYTFMIKKDFLILISNFFSNHKLETELDLILYLLSYTSIEKVPKVLYYFTNSRIPYPENIIIDNTLNSLNKISIFNKNKSIEYRNYLSEAILTKSNINILNTDIKYNILVIISNLSVGGTETYILAISKALKEFGIHTYIITSGGILEDLFLKNHIPVLKINLNIDYCYTIKYIIEIVDKYAIKLIQLHLPNYIDLLGTLFKYLKIPIILTLHGTFYSKSLIQNNLKYLSKIIFVSTEVQNYYSDLITNDNKSFCSVIPNAIETSIYKSKNNFLSELLSIPIDAKVILYCSRLSPSKASLAITFLKSFENIISTNNNVYAIIIGEGSDKILIDSYSQNINSSHNNKKVFVIGAVYNVLDYYLNSNFIVGTGRVALEAMSCSKAVISLGLNGASYIVNKNNISYMISNNFGDHSSKSSTNQLGIYSVDLTNNITYLLTNTVECESIGSWCKDYCTNNLNLIQSAKYISKIFDNILDI